MIRLILVYYFHNVLNIIKCFHIYCTNIVSRTIWFSTFHSPIEYNMRKLLFLAINFRFYQIIDLQILDYRVYSDNFNECFKEQFSFKKPPKFAFFRTGQSYDFPTKTMVDIHENHVPSSILYCLCPPESLKTWIHPSAIIRLHKCYE